MSEKHSVPPELGEGAEAVMRWALDALGKERESAAVYLEDLRDQIEWAEASLHEAIRAEREVAELVNGRMYLAGTDRGQDFDVNSLDAEVCPDALIWPERVKRGPAPPVVALPVPILAQLGAAWQSLDVGRYAAGAPTFLFGSSNEAEEINTVAHPEPALHAKIAEIVAEDALPPALVAQLSPAHPARQQSASVKGSVKPEERVEAKDGSHLDGALSLLFETYPYLTYRRIQDHLGISNGRANAAVKYLAARGKLRIEKSSEPGKPIVDHILPPANGAEDPPGRVPPHKVERAREMMRHKGYNLTTVAGMLDVSKRDLHAALHPNGSH